MADPSIGLENSYRFDSGLEKPRFFRKSFRVFRFLRFFKLF